MSCYANELKISLTQVRYINIEQDKYLLDTGM